MAPSVSGVETELALTFPRIIANMLRVAAFGEPNWL